MDPEKAPAEGMIVEERRMVLDAGTSTSGLYAALTFHHARLEASGRHVLSTLHLEGPSGAKRSFVKFKRELDAHLEAEERWVLPAYGLIRPQAKEVICREHEQIRAMADRFARSLDTRRVDEPALCQLLELLGLHCRREEPELYRWAETAIGEPESRAVIQRIETSEFCEEDH
jgi:hypothetical protein